MGLPRYHEQPVLLLMYRTMTNLEFINRHKSNSGPFEVTQLINSCLSVIAHPWDRLLDASKLKRIKVGGTNFREMGFPNLPAVPEYTNQQPIENLEQLLRKLRNSFAHGNMEILSRKDLRRLRGIGPIPRVKEDEIAGLKLWNQNDNSNINWCVTVDIYELERLLKGMMKLCEKRSLWLDTVRIEQDGRDTKRRSRA